MTNIVVDKSTDNVEPLSICFLPQYSTPKKVFISQRDQNLNQNHDTKIEQALAITSRNMIGLLTARPWAESGSCCAIGFFFVFVLSES